MLAKVRLRKGGKPRGREHSFLFDSASPKPNLNPYPKPNQLYAPLGDVAGDMELPKPGPVRPAAAPFAALWFVDYAFAKVPQFRYVERGAMASMGMGGGILDLGKAQQGAPGITGVAAAAVWKGAYWTKQLSWANMMLIPMYWFKTLMFGRDISRF